MSSSSVPIIPGYYGDDQSDSRLQKEAEAIGYPVLLKADRGGGGKGMRIVESSDEFQTMLNQCRSEARNFFSDDKVLIEKYITKPRHVEVQVFADRHGNAVHLFERDCSVQRRHQKIIEEAPAPLLDIEVRRGLWETAVRAAKAVGYVGAGTVEFIMDEQQQFYFMEMNTRLQVEHPVTEMITGTDLVEWQLKVASGAVLPRTQDQIVQNGHAFEARICAEDPDQNFIPSPGRLHHYQPPPVSDTVRIDTGVGQGDVVTGYYDSMVSKLIVWDKDRESALRKLQNCLMQYQIAGLKTNKEFVARLAGHPNFKQADVHTGFIPQHQSTLFAPRPALTPYQLALAALSLLSVEASKTNISETDPYSPFSTNTGDRVNLLQTRKILLQSSQGQDTTENHEIEVAYHPDAKYSLTINGTSFLCNAHLTKDKESYIIHGNLGESFFTANVAIIDRTMYVFCGDQSYTVTLPLPKFFESLQDQQMGGAKTPPYSSRVTKVLVKTGEKVNKGDILVTVEGMKLETNILAQEDGVVAEVLVSEGETVPGNSSVIQYET
ncbi:methylcrotonoyl-CoA carboxylase subunit alpha, mitochondrial-like isoform X2 [Dysidea avara]